MNRILIALASIVMVIVSHMPVSAMNWEGHDDWLEHQDHARRLQMILPKPPAMPLPHCDERARLSSNNPYEQRPVPGKNCFDNEALDGEFPQN